MTVSLFPALWVRASDLLAAPYSLSNNDPVSVWKGPTSGQFEQATSSKQPVFKTNQVNGYPAVEFVRAGTPDWMEYSATLGVTSSRTFIVVARKIGTRAASPGADRYWVCGSDGAAMVEGGFDNASYFADSAGVDEVAFPRVLTTPGFNVFSVRATSISSAQVYTNLIAGEHFDPWDNAIVGNSVFRIGAQLDEANAISAQFAEILVINQNLSDSLFKGLVYGLMVKYAIPVDVAYSSSISLRLSQGLGLQTSLGLDQLAVAIPRASSTVSGTVKTDVDDPEGDPVVYLKESVDALIAGLELDDLSDVDAPTPSDGDVLTFDSGSGDWVPEAPTGGGGGALDDLTDVDTTGETAGDVLTFDGADWIPVALPTIPADLDDLSDVDTTGQSTGDVLTYDGADWVPQAPAVVGGSGTVAGIFPLDVRPGSPHAKDDEFDGTSLSGIWTSPAVTANGLTLAVADGWVSFEPDTAGTGSLSGRMFGIRQAAPSGSFTLTAKIASSKSAAAGTDSYDGLFVGVSGGKGHVFGIGRNASAALANMGATTYGEGGSDWSAFDGYNNVHTGTELCQGYLTGWYRLQWDSGAGTLTFYFSFNGFRWEGWNSRSGQSQPTSIGIGMYAQSNTFRADKAMAVDWFRVTEP